VFTFFLVVTLGFEKILHLITRSLKRQGKHGLVVSGTSYILITCIAFTNVLAPCKPLRFLPAARRP
jgi:hypothetical protein